MCGPEITSEEIDLSCRYEDPEEDSANVAGFMKGLLSKTESIDGKFRYVVNGEDCVLLENDG